MEHGLLFALALISMRSYSGYEITKNLSTADEQNGKEPLHLLLIENPGKSGKNIHIDPILPNAFAKILIPKIFT